MKHSDPVIKKNTSFSILLLRDDSGVVKFRLNSFWIKLLTFFFIIFSAASGAAGYAAHYYWKKYHTLQRERSELTAKLGENRRQLGRFAGIEKIKESSLPRSAMSGIATAAGPDTLTEAEPSNGTLVRNGQEVEPQPPVLTNGKAVAQAPVQPVGNGDSTAQTNGTAKPAPTQQPQQQTSERPTSGTLTTASGPETPDTDAAVQTGANAAKAHPASVDEVQIKGAGAAKYRLSFDLSNRDQQITLNGRVFLYVSTKSGAKHEITQVSRDSLRFLINRFKKVTTTFALPDDVQPADAATLHVMITAEKIPDITYDFPFPES